MLSDTILESMNNHLFTILAVFAILLAVFIAMFNMLAALYLIGGVLVFGIGLLIYRWKF